MWAPLASSPTPRLLAVKFLGDLMDFAVQESEELKLLVRYSASVIILYVPSPQQGVALMDCGRILLLWQVSEVC